MSDEDKTFKLCSQLHKQYAEADNNKNHNLIYFITSIIFIFTGYGYVYKYMKYDVAAFIFVSVLVLIMLVAIITISINYGYTQRRDQIIIYRIRHHYIDDVEYIKLFGDLYNPIGKNIWKFIPDYYKFWVLLSLVLQILVIVFSIVVINGFDCECAKSCYCISYYKLVAILGVASIVLIIDFALLYHYYRKYDDFSKKEVKFKCSNATFLFDFKTFPKNGTFEISHDKITDKIQIKISES